jgi:uncharacterized protein YlxP (DUF503 family)
MNSELPNTYESITHYARNYAYDEILGCIFKHVKQRVDIIVRDTAYIQFHTNNSIGIICINTTENISNKALENIKQTEL